MDVVLVMFMADGERREFALKGKTTVGRDSECGLQVSLAEISRRHCEISVKKDKIAVRDLGSSNGTYVNNKRIQQGTLKAGDKLTVGPVIFTVVVDGKPAEVKPVKTILDGKKAPAEKKVAAADSKDESGSVDLMDSGALKLDDDSRDSTSLAGLEERESKKK